MTNLYKFFYLSFILFLIPACNQQEEPLVLTGKWVLDQSLQHKKKDYRILNPSHICNASYTFQTGNQITVMDETGEVHTGKYHKQGEITEILISYHNFEKGYYIQQEGEYLDITDSTLDGVRCLYKQKTG